MAAGVVAAGVLEPPLPVVAGAADAAVAPEAAADAAAAGLLAAPPAVCARTGMAIKKEAPTPTASILISRIEEQPLVVPSSEGGDLTPGPASLVGRGFGAQRLVDVTDSAIA
jgi:hypothetical protein